MEEIEKALENIYALMQKIIEQLVAIEEKGGPGSGRKPEGGNVPRSGVRPSAANPNRTEISYNEEKPSDNRPRSGVRPSSVKPKR